MDTLSDRPIQVRSHRWAGFSAESRVVRGAPGTVAPTLLIGGAMQRKEEWGRLEKHLLEVGDVVTVDLPGWGAADPLPDSYGADFLAATLDHVLDECELTRLNVFAGSYGTAIAYRLAQNHPTRVRRLALASGMLTIPDHAAQAMRRILDLLDAGDLPAFADACVDLLCGSGGSGRAQAVRRVLLRRFRQAPADELARHAANTRRLLRHRMIDTGSPVQAPVLVISGERDEFTPPRLARALAASCADSWFTVIADVGHMVHLERPDWATELVQRFFTGRPLAGPAFVKQVERVSGRSSTGDRPESCAAPQVDPRSRVHLSH